MRDGAVSEAVEAGDRAACLQDVEEDRRDEQRRDHICAVVRWSISSSISVQVLHCRKFCSVLEECLAEHLVLRQRSYLYLPCTLM